MINIREVSFDDFKNITLLEKRNGLYSRSHEEWKHLWENNPTIVDNKRPWPIGWVLENDDEQLIGYLGSIPIAYDFKDKKLIAAIATAFVVDVAYRDLSFLLTNNLFSQKYADLLLVTTANDKAGKFFSAFGFQKIPVDSYAIPLFWVTNYRGFVLSIMAKNKIPLGYIAGYPLSSALWSIDKLIGRNQYIGRLNGEIRYCTTFDERFDVFWDNLKKKYHGRLLCMRNARYLNWHFKYAIAHKKIWIFVTENKSQITNYAVFLRQDTPEIGLKRIRLVDFQTIDENPDILMKMVSSGIKRCRKEGIDMLEIVGFNSKKRSLAKKYFPYERKFPAFPFFYKAKNKLLAKELENPNVWDPCFFDGDASL